MAGSPETPTPAPATALSVPPLEPSLSTSAPMDLTTSLTEGTLISPSVLYHRINKSSQRAGAVAPNPHLPLPHALSVLPLEPTWSTSATIDPTTSSTEGTLQSWLYTSRKKSSLTYLFRWRWRWLGHDLLRIGLNDLYYRIFKLYNTIWIFLTIKIC